MKFSFLSNSIFKPLRFSYILIIILMTIPILFSLTLYPMYTNHYDQLITNVSRANKLNQIIKINISDEIWDIVAGKKSFKQGNQYKLIEDTKDIISEMIIYTKSDNNKQLLEVAKRAVKTLEKYVNILGNQINNNAPVSKNEKTLEEIRSVASLIHDIIEDYIFAEIETYAQTNNDIKKSSTLINIFQIITTIFVIIIAIIVIKNLSKKIQKPINDMEKFSTKIAKGDLSARTEVPHIAEFDNLTSNLNIMAEKIHQLIQQNIQEQKNLKKAELKTLQAQITPHFLYNTFDTIIWLAESEKTNEVIEITRAFSNFFRISLSKGHEWISLEQEVNHVKNYLKIQKIRYRDILDYQIEYDEKLNNTKVLKLILQPLVENAIYHGIKNKRGKGILRIKVSKTSKDNILFSVEDNGIGFTEERLKDVEAQLQNNIQSESLSSTYGMYNVCKRLQLYYNKNIKLNIQSEYKKGTKISFELPYIKIEDNQNV